MSSAEGYVTKGWGLGYPFCVRSICQCSQIITDHCPLINLCLSCYFAEAKFWIFAKYRLQYFNFHLICMLPSPTRTLLSRWLWVWVSVNLFWSLRLTSLPFKSVHVSIKIDSPIWKSPKKSEESSFQICLHLSR